MRVIRLCLFFALGLFLGGFAVYASAETIPATYGYVYVPPTSTTWLVGAGNPKSASTPKAACSAWIGVNQGHTYNATFTGNISEGRCVLDTYYNPSIALYSSGCPNGYGQINTGTNDQGLPIPGCKSTTQRYSCPTNEWSLSRSSCTRPDCSADEERVNDVCVAKCATGEIRKEDGTCRPYCWGAQFYDELSNSCRCTTQQPSTTSWQVSQANATAGKLDPPSCVNGCEQGVSTFGGLSVSFCPGGLATMIVGGSTTCYGKVGQTGAICAPDGSAPAGSLVPVSVTPAPAGTSPTGTADPYSTTPNNADPTSCASAGGNWGVFNGQGNCYTPSTSDPMVTQNQQQNVVTNPDGSKQTTTTTTTNTCTGAGACTNTTTTNTTNTAAGGGGGRSGTTVTTNNGSGTATGTVTKTGDGQYKIDLPKDYQKDSTGLILNALVSEVKDVIGKPVADDSSLTGAKASDEAKKALTDAEKLFTDALNGADIAGLNEKLSVWEQTMREGWWEPISISGCSPFSHTFNFFSTSYTWTLDHCPTAAKISEIGAYCMWIMLLFSGFRMITTPRRED